MGIQARNQLCFCLMLAVIVISMPIILAESSKLYVDDVNETNTISSSPCSKKYITKSYFEKHASLRDPDYQVFMAHEFPCGSCKALPDNLNSMVGVSVPQRNLMGEGSHRHLVSSIKFHLQEAIFELPEHFCQAVVVERLPSGVFADPFELQHLVQRSEFADAAVFGDTNLELPSALTNRSVVEVHMNIGHNKLSRKEKGLEFNIDLPLHARYPPLGESGYARVEMNAPDIFIRCRTEEKLNCSNLLWMMTADYEDLKPGSLIWKIPSENNSGNRPPPSFLSLSPLEIKKVSILQRRYVRMRLNLVARLERERQKRGVSLSSGAWCWCEVGQGNGRQPRCFW